MTPTTNPNTTTEGGKPSRLVTGGSHITIECSAGSSIEGVSGDAQRIADLLGIIVEFRFNDVWCMASPGGDAALLAERQQEQQRRKLENPLDRRFAHSRRPVSA